MRVVRTVGVLLVLTACAGIARAQTAAGLTGIVKDATGAVLPGVSVEAASPALIERVRSTVTDGQGRFNIVDLRPGVYSVTFTLTGFGTVKRQGIEVSAGSTATVNADMKVGAVEETVTVTGAATVVDIQNTRTQQVLKEDVLEALPSGQRGVEQYASLTLGATSTTQGRNDVGGAQGETNTGIAIHGGRGDDGKINYDGMNTNVFYEGAGGQQRIWKFNTMAVQETVIDTGGANVESETGGANVNMVPRDGGNRFSMRAIANYTNQNLSDGQVPASAIARGAPPEANTVKKVYDYGFGAGGPIVKDKLWWYNADRWWGGQQYGTSPWAFFNASTNPLQYVPDHSRPAFGDTYYTNIDGRLTWQATSKMKVTTSLDYEVGCNCYLTISLGSPLAPEAAISFGYGEDNTHHQGMYLSQTSWTYVATNKLLFQATASFLVQAVSFTNANKPGPLGFVFDASQGFGWGALPGGSADGYDQPQQNNNFTQKATMSYITGSHQFKTGVQTQEGIYNTHGDAAPNGYNVILNATPTPGLMLLQQYASPFDNNVSVRATGVFAQDQWTIRRITLNLGARYDHFNAFAPAITVPAGPFKPQQSFAELDNVPNYNDITGRIGAAWDIFGNGKTALKASFGKYLAGLGGGDAKSLSPSNTTVQSDLRPWFDFNHNGVPDCNLGPSMFFAPFGTNGECGGFINPNFGGQATTQTWDSRAANGWGVREFSYQTSVALQHQLRNNLGVTIAYNRNDWRNEQAVINMAVSPSDYTSYCIQAPTDPRLGSVSGQKVCGVYDLNPNAFGRLPQNVRMRIQDIPGNNGGQPKDVFNGVDMGATYRFGHGGLVAGGVTVGRTTVNTCWMNNLPNVDQVNFGVDGSNGGSPVLSPRTNGFCNVTSPWWDGVGSQAKVQIVYPLPKGFILSGSYKNLPGIPIQAAVSSIQAPPINLGRDLTGTGFAYYQLAPAPFAGSTTLTATLFDNRLNEVDMRVTKSFTIGRYKFQPVAELYNVFNSRPSQGNNDTYGPTWNTPGELLGGRLFKFGAQMDF
ncbi:MAG TPA: carboxypeptidase regulatory-like domain-containing protein [Vicinamibacterales bacterium]|jgi:hypothetical protein|nr:carboxypeptidase regulatory-like domain-containing protein [Vicinamibacterales bacterium]